MFRRLKLRRRKTVVHITNDAVLKCAQNSRIGDVLEGLFTSRPYLDTIDRSILIGPLSRTDDEAHNHLDENLRILYSSLDGVANHPYSDNLTAAERKFGVSIVYGHRDYYNRDTGQRSQVEVVLIDATRANIHPVNVLKAWMFDEFNLPSDRYEKDPQYDQCVRLAPAALAVLRAIGASDPDCPTVLISHDYSGVPTVLAANMDPLGAFKTMYCAHEVPTVRRIVETYPGHDTMFDNAMNWAKQNNYYLSEMFGAQNFFFQHALVTAGRHCDNIVAISDRVKQELCFLEPHFEAVNIDLAYSGLSAHPISLNQKKTSKARLQQYAHNLLGYKPDHIFTRFTSMTAGEALWRDLRVLYHLEQHFQRDGRGGVYFLLSTDSSLCDGQDVHHYEQSWNWPVAHREEDGDLSELEAAFYTYIQEFNARNRNIKAILINHLDRDSQTCGTRMPRDMEFADLHQGSDLEFNQSIYEPLGVASLETLAFGGLSVISGGFGCNGLFEYYSSAVPDNVIVADYAQINSHQFGREDILAIKQSGRDQIEERVSGRVAQIIQQRIPQNDEQIQSLLQQGGEFIRQMTWESVCEKYFLPAIERAYHKRRPRQIA